MKVYKINCEWEMPIATGYFESKALALEAIREENWEDVDFDSWEEVLDLGLVSVEEIDVKVEDL